jgi:hypothetical protein
MSRPTGMLNLSGNLEVQAGAPLDSRSVVPTLADLTTAANFPYPYVGMETYVVAENKKYRLIATPVTSSSNWEEVGSGGSQITVDSALDETSENPVQNKVIKEVLDTTYKTDDGGVSGAFQDNDYFPLLSTGLTPPQRKIDGASIKATLKYYFDAIYSTVKSRGTPASGGTALSLVNTGDMYNWNNKQNALTAGNNISISGNVISGTNTPFLNFSTSEQRIGTWTDGKPVYQKNIHFTATKSSTSSNPLSIPFSDLGITNAKVLIDAGVYYMDSSVAYQKHVARCDFINNTLKIRPYENIQFTDLIIQYTKTTD